MKQPCPSVEGWVGWIGGSALASSKQQHDNMFSKQTTSVPTARSTLMAGGNATCNGSPYSNQGSTPAKGDRIMATSASIAAPKLSDRALLSDRKTFFAHLHPRPFLISIIRISSITASTIFATYVTDQIEYETANEKLVSSGQITATECDDRNKAWEDVQWKMRWSDYKMKALVAFGKFQATTLLIRLYERIADQRLKVGDEVLDKLTKDAFASGRRKVERNGRDANGNKLTRSEMITTCLWANAIPFLADATVQWSVLAYGYYTFWKGRQARRRKDEELAKLEYEIDGTEMEVVEGDEVAKNSSMDFGTNDEGDAFVVPPSDANDAAAGDEICIPEDGWDSEEAKKKDADQEDEVAAVTMLLLLKSCRIAFSRGIGWVAASYGGAYGTTMWPGWGTLLGSSMADSMVASVLDG